MALPGADAVAGAAGRGGGGGPLPGRTLQRRQPGELSRRRTPLHVRLDRRRARIGFPVLDLAGAAAGLRRVPARTRLCVAGHAVRRRPRPAHRHVAAPPPRDRPGVPELCRLPHRHRPQRRRRTSADLHRHAGASTRPAGLPGILLPLRERREVPRRFHPARDRAPGRRPESARPPRRLSGRDRADARTPADAQDALRLHRPASPLGPGPGRYLQRRESAVQHAGRQAAA